MKIYVLILIIYHANFINGITKDWSFIFGKSFQKNNITLWGKAYDCKIDFDDTGDVYAYCNDIFMGTSKSSAVDHLDHDCYPGSNSKRCDMFSLHDGDYCGNTHRTGVLHMQCAVDYEGLVGVIEESSCHSLIGITVKCPESFFIPTITPTFSPTLALEDTNYTMLSNLGFPQQRERKLLVAITAHSLREQILVVQLQNYVNICNAGWEVHIVIVTCQKIWDIPQYQYIWQSSMFYCDRLTRMLPIVVQWFESDGRLAAKHRIVFKELVNRYDFYLSAEDDMIMKLQHLHYYAKWSSKLKGSNFYPGLNTVELPISMTRRPYSINHKDNPFIWRSFTANYDQGQKYFQIIKINDTAYIYYCKDWAPAYIITQELLLFHSSQPTWLADEFKKFNEYNTHFQHLWLARHYKLVIPLHDFWLSWIHHSPDRYTGLSFDKMLETKDPNHKEHEAFHNYYNHLPTIIEFNLFLENCTGFTIDIPHGYDNLHHKNLTWQQDINYEKGVKCSMCLANNHFAQVTLKFKGNYSFESRRSNIDARIICEDSYIFQGGMKGGGTDTVESQKIEYGHYF